MTDLDAVARKLRNRANTMRGDYTQEIVGHRLRVLGLKMVQRIATGWRLQRGKHGIMGATPLAKVHADFTAIVPGTGQSVRCEVKARRDGVLSLADFAPHQVRALTEHHELGGLSLVGWVHTHGVDVLRWPIAGLATGSPLHVGDRRHLAARWCGVGPTGCGRGADSASGADVDETGT